jgi:hypothetical protein
METNNLVSSRITIPLSPADIVTYRRTVGGGNITLSSDASEIHINLLKAPLVNKHPLPNLGYPTRLPIPFVSLPERLSEASTQSFSVLLCIYTGDGNSCKQHRVHITYDTEMDQVVTGKEMFLTFRTVYNTRLRSFWQRFFSLRTLKYIDILEVSPVAINHLHHSTTKK